MYLQRNLFQGEIVKFLNSDFSIGEISSKLPNCTRRRFLFYLLLTLLLCILFIFYLPRCTLLDFYSISSQASLPFLSCCHRTITLYILLIFYLPLCTPPDFHSISSPVSLSFLSCCHGTTITLHFQHFLYV